MSDPTTVNRNFTVPPRGADVGTWDTPLNGNFNSLDLIAGGIQSVAVSNASVTLTSDQAENGTIVVTGTLTGSVSIIFPAVQGWWSIDNQTTSSGGTSFALYAASVGGTNRIGCPPGEQIDIQVNGAVGVKYRNLDRVGSYLDLAASAVPLWITGSTIPPYLNCDGSTFSGTTYPALAERLGGTTLPDLRGRARFFLNGGTSRITAAASGINGDTLLASGGVQAQAIFRTYLPSLSLSVNIPAGQGSHDHNLPLGPGISTAGGGSAINFAQTNGTGFNTFSNVLPAMSGTAALNGDGTLFPMMNPATISGLCLIRAA